MMRALKIFLVISVFCVEAFASFYNCERPKTANGAQVADSPAYAVRVIGEHVDLIVLKWRIQTAGNYVLELPRVRHAAPVERYRSEGFGVKITRYHADDLPAKVHLAIAGSGAEPFEAECR